MAFSASLAIAAAAALLANPVDAGLYPKNSAVLSLTGKTYESLIAQSNHTSVSVNSLFLQAEKLT
jgi:protein disulfide-isomerase A6